MLGFSPLASAPLGDDGVVSAEIVEATVRVLAFDALIKVQNKAVEGIKALWLKYG